MPTVPRLTGQEVALQPTRAPQIGLNVSARDFGAQSARDMQEAGGNLMRAAGSILSIAEVDRSEEEARQLLELDRKASERLRNFMEAPETGLLYQRGVGARGATARAEAELESIWSDLSKDVASDRVRTKFEQMFSTRRERTIGQASGYEREQTIAALDAEAKAYVLSAVEDAASGYNDPEAIAEAMLRGEAAIRANRRGQAPEVVAQELDAFRSTLHKGVIDRALVHDPMGAREYLEANRDEISGADIAAIEKAVKVGELRGESQAEADRIASMGLGYSAALAEARRITNPELRDEVTTRIKQRFAEQEQARAMEDRAAKDRAWSIIESGGSMDDLPPSLKATLDGTTLAAMEKRIAQKLEGTDPITNKAVYASLMDMAGLEQEKFADLDLRQHANDLSGADMARFQEMQRQYRLGGKEAESAWGSVETLREGVKTLARAAGLDPSPKEGTPAAERLAEFYTDLSQSVQRLEQAKGGKATDEEVKGEALRLLLKGSVETDWWPDRETYLFQAAPGDVAKFYVDYDDLPPMLAQEIETRLMEVGVPTSNLTEEFVARAATLYARGDKAGFRALIEEAKR